ncbi:hypothetical protein FN846DRAFT_786447 [Sphaerosporella brunnea]|uniref:Uncharacterized protein n=1 Tax=Sphaerosporella brunnea TaxID=1250544 RepID=A0A5J5EFA9_9PEZI|nr:hypothetical protein FN846DRAFT_786446 [Sphaerosporella brunnea]KAA8894368.1 hypothetical protein FN846DRAFT_786447 [Sphaerosporella brunnea]
MKENIAGQAGLLSSISEGLLRSRARLLPGVTIVSNLSKRQSPRRGEKMLDLFYVDQHKMLFHKIMCEDGAWTAEGDLGGPSGTALAAVSWGPDRLDDVFAVDVDRKLLHRWWDQ